MIESIVSRSGEPFVCSTGIVVMTKARIRQHVDALCSLHRSIPYVSWGPEDFLANGVPGRHFTGKWDLSCMILDGAGRLVGFMVAYLRERSSAHPYRSLYLHRMAVHADYRGRGIARHILALYAERARQYDPLLEYSTLQTNVDPANQWIIDFYERMGYEKTVLVRYPEKTDWLMVRQLAISR